MKTVTIDARGFSLINEAQEDMNSPVRVTAHENPATSYEVYLLAASCQWFELDIDNYVTIEG
ncbi:hypothetical protein LPP1_g12 [Leptolyngbya phage LPP-1]|uniref:Uncharacterized protein n=1 Tax=Leptolyngbya phage LPP-1 TaxID=2996049 RepID=A0AAE9TKL1_9CAUD|nr:hypothetical protein LPP1_g12 [Leptolyngbya phage LPP-1]